MRWSLEDGRLVWVEAASERLLEIRAPSEHAPDAA